MFQTQNKKEEHTNWLFNTIWSALKTYIQARLYELSMLYSGMYMSTIHTHTHTYRYAITTNEYRHEFEENKEEYMEGFGGKKGKEEMYL